MQQESVIGTQFAFQAGLPIFLIAVVGGLSSVGAGLFTGTALIGPINAIIEVAPKLLNFTGLLPALTGIGLGRSPSGVISLLRGEWAPVARRRALLGGLLAFLAALSGLPGAGVVTRSVLSSRS